MRERLLCRPGNRSVEDAVYMMDSIRPGKWEAGASHAEPELRPTGGFIIIDGRQGGTLSVAALKAAKKQGSFSIRKFSRFVFREVIQRAVAVA